MSTYPSPFHPAGKTVQTNPRVTGRIWPGIARVPRQAAGQPHGVKLVLEREEDPNLGADIRDLELQVDDRGSYSYLGDGTGQRDRPAI